MSQSIECALCYNWGSDDETGWITVLVEGQTQWHCPRCLLASGQIVEATAPSCEPAQAPNQPQPEPQPASVAALAAPEPAMNALALSGGSDRASPVTLDQWWRAKLFSWRLDYGDEIRVVLLTLGCTLAVCLALGFLSGLINVNLPRAMAAALGGGLVFWVLLTLMVIGLTWTNDGYVTWLGILVPFLVGPVFFATFAILIAPFMTFDRVSLRDFPGFPGAFGLGALYVAMSALAGLAITMPFIFMGMLGNILGGTLTSKERTVAYTFVALVVLLGVLGGLVSLGVRQLQYQKKREEFWELYEEEQRRESFERDLPAAEAAHV
jgi:hypothetical protein